MRAKYNFEFGNVFAHGFYTTCKLMQPQENKKIMLSLKPIVKT